MIDAATFAVSYNAFWRTFAPTCELFVRRLNLDGYERFHPPMAASDATSRNALTAEYAFSLFAAIAKTDHKLALSRELHEHAWIEAVRRLAPYASSGLDLDSPLTAGEQEEAGQIFESLRRYFLLVNPEPLTVRPIFSGCGFIDASEGDVILGKTICEVKTVDRTFRSTDVRQLVTYAALNFAAPRYEVDSLGLFNPRRGVSCRLDLEHVSAEISGRPATELLSIIVSSISSGEISR